MQNNGNSLAHSPSRKLRRFLTGVGDVRDHGGPTNSRPACCIVVVCSALIDQIANASSPQQAIDGVLGLCRELADGVRGARL